MAASSNKTLENQTFGIICVMGAPGAGKGTLCTHLAERFNLVHYSIGDNLRTWMRENSDTPLALRIQSKLDNQGFLSSEDLNPFLFHAVKKAKNSGQSNAAGIMFDGYPRCIEQLESFDTESAREELCLAASNDFHDVARSVPDVVLFFDVTRQNARVRYLGRARDANDSEDKFDKRYAEFEAETLPVVERYKQKGILISVDANGTKERTAEVLMKALEGSMIWQRAVIMNSLE
ncbi:adenylate kinase 1 ATP binding protein [Karstenula rhodostoma CBS 690.94]|uniref:Adenylate kinase 1 ATP binding protein n=1 Tax=Karstenula rhodostoma CBS 690.94 TaxID=1392251 RepID=A0A9P4P6X5_9PLEO|nr:adenylate kinase 1 ATP binding protein [Karstenula rhodostoma CBS 690.94]